MISATQSTKVCFWLQTSQSAKVQILYRLKNDSLNNKTAAYTTQDSSFFISQLYSSELLPNSWYKYQLLINDKPVQFDFPLEFKSPPGKSLADTITIAAGSCTFVEEGFLDSPNPRYGGDYRIFNTIAATKPDLMIWLGDNVYLRGNDWNSRYDIYERYKQTRTLPHLQELLTTTKHLAIWDDHDYGPNDATSLFLNKHLTKKAFSDHWPGPNYPVVGNYYTVKWADIQFFMLDDRTFRTTKLLHVPSRKILGDIQLSWLEKELQASTATFKIICMGGQVLNPAKVWENYSRYPREQNKLLGIIDQNNIKGVIFISGDRHHSVLTEVKRERKYSLYDVTISPLTSGSHSGNSEKNTAKVTGTMVTNRNFGILQITGSPENRKLEITIKDPDGKSFWSRTISASEINK